MKHSLHFITACASALLALPALSSALSEPTTESKKDPIIKDIGADFRYRIINEDNRKLDSGEASGERLWQRFRLRAWASIRIVPKAELNIRAVTEPRYYNYPDLSSDDYESWVRDEFLIDTLNLTLNDPFDLPLQAVLGRQSIQFAENWLVGEGTPLDGTRTAYFDALRTTLNLQEGQTKLDLIYIDNRKDSSAYITPINDFSFDMIEQDERGAIAWLSHEVAERRFVDTYFIYKKDHNPTYVGGTKVGVAGESYTVGLRGHGNATENLSFNAEIAPQFGHKNGSTSQTFWMSSRHFLRGIRGMALRGSSMISMGSSLSKGTVGRQPSGCVLMGSPWSKLWARSW